MYLGIFDDWSFSVCVFAGMMCIWSIFEVLIDFDSTYYAFTSLVGNDFF